MLHRGICRSYSRIVIVILVQVAHATVITLIGTVLGDYTINPDGRYQPKRKTIDSRNRGFNRSQCPETSHRVWFLNLLEIVSQPR